MIPYGHQTIGDDDIAAVISVLKSEWLTQGPEVEDLEAELARSVDAEYAVVFSHGTAALHAAALAADLGTGDVVVTSPLSFVASANCARYVGAGIGFVDIDPGTLNIDLDRVPKSDALVAVHYAGLPVDLGQLAKRPRIVIEDAAHALGATTPHGPVGNCAYSDMCVFSFHPVKAITTGEGGAVTTNDSALAQSLKRIRNHGIVKRPEMGGWYYDITDLGFNFRLTDMQAALGRSQLLKLSDFVTSRQRIAHNYDSLLAALPIDLPPRPKAGFSHAYHLYPVRTDRRDLVFAELRRRQIGVQVHYIPIHLHPAFEALGFKRGAFPNAEAAYSSLLSLPLFPGLTDAEQHQVVGALGDSLAQVGVL